jgi:gas vesicle protein
MENNTNTNSFDIGIFAGMAIGLAIALLYAPQSGRETRAILRKKVLEIQKKAGEVAEKLS